MTKTEMYAKLRAMEREMDQCPGCGAHRTIDLRHHEPCDFVDVMRVIALEASDERARPAAMPRVEVRGVPMDATCDAMLGGPADDWTVTVPGIRRYYVNDVEVPKAEYDRLQQVAWRGAPGEQE